MKEIATTFATFLMDTFSMRPAFILVTICVFIFGCQVTDQAPPPVAPIAPPDTLRCDVQVYCILGLANIYSLGLYDLAKELRSDGVPASAVSDSDYKMLASDLVAERAGGKDTRPLVLVGHSYGADDCLRIAETLKAAGLTVRLVILIDPTSPPDVPDNIDKCINYYIQDLSGDLMPDLFSGNPIPVAAGNTHTLLINQEITPALDPEYSNIDHASLWIMKLLLPSPDTDPTITDHLNLDSSPALHRFIRLEISKLCS